MIVKGIPTITPIKKTISKITGNENLKGDFILRTLNTIVAFFQFSQ